ncbi:MAG: hypothetical protein PHV66_10150 [Bacteroidales bacterium]|nr:hypothetical protein [Bacteroidales bacterium]
MKKILIEDIKIKKSPIQKTIPKAQTQKEETVDFAIPDSVKKEEVSISKTKPPRSRRRISITPREHSRKPVGGFLKTLFFLSLIFGLIYWFGVLFSSAYVTITAKHQTIDYKSKVFMANRKLDKNSVDFEIMIESEKKQKDYILTESKEVSSKATGSIIIYNEFSTKPEKLSKGTYISDQEGKTYRLDSSVVIPGYKMDKQKKIPGQVKVGVTSFLAGENYNGAPEKFFKNSFKGTTKYSKIYGKLDQELKGGLQGMVYYVSEEDVVKLKQIAESSFKNELFSKIKALLPSGYILYPGSINFNYKIDSGILSETAEAKVPIEGILSAVLIKEDSLIKNITRVSMPDVTEKEMEEIIINGIKELNFSFVNAQEISKDMENFDFSLTGTLEVVWNPDKETLKSKLSGTPKNEVLPIFRQDRGIDKALVKIFPPWNKYIPNNPSKINIKIQ